MGLKAPFPYFGGKSSVAELVWSRLGRPKHYIEPFCGSAAMLLAAPAPASLEVINDLNGFIANFWRAVRHQAEAVAEWADYPVSHVDLGGRHPWLMEQRNALAEGLGDPNWPGDAKVAGWWLWGQCCWIGSGWCDWAGKVPHASDAGMGVQAVGQVPHASDAGMGVQAVGQVPHVGNAGRDWLLRLSRRLSRVRAVHGTWDRCLNTHYGGSETAVFLDPPYTGFEGVYGAPAKGNDVAAWAREHGDLAVALCGHQGDYDLDWERVDWSRGRFTYSGNKTTDNEAIWFSPGCSRQERLPL